ncbi:diguanylate cyclase (GGDEF)-like protein [Novosphingobium hassiacum]|uniref:Diguanylate cyclase (GGDEF)-like protein n=1 Tax=Novosphingobium hassiacum TaxID=173676 RepID=A0A7W6EU85_9SPHN|nr:EAL domain-containing protein [Novosphingobium hassiacum]MBB3858856.1 diguanylate cyclase (GGDEF)-like protein [Novosphingobium hassiacum]
MPVRGIIKRLSRGQPDTEGTVAPSPARVRYADTADARLMMLDEFEQAGLAWLWATDAGGKLSYLSATACVDASGLYGVPLTAVVETDIEDPEASAARPLSFLLSTHARIADLIVRFSGAAGQDGRWWALSGHPLKQSDGTFAGYRGFARDVTREYRRKRDDSKAAEFDSLTGLFNRYRMTRRIDGMLAAFRPVGRCCGLMMLDLDRFKHVNDTMGHPAGDELLRQVAERLRKVVGDRGEVGRLGGDEFQIVLPDHDDRGRLGEIAARVIQMLSQPYVIEGKRAVIGASVGVAVAPHDGDDRETLVASADLALYAAKNGGRGQFRFFGAELKDEALERTTLSEDLREALGSDEIDLHYQPVVRIEDNMVVGFEALMRWNHPERGAIPPAVFIPVAEETNLIVPLGDWALRQACADAADWPASVRVAVNVSAVQFAVPGFVTSVASALAASGIDPDRLELELTETVFMRDSEAVDEVFAALKGLGVRLALDDFGTGYSSLSYLRSAPFDKLKVDRSFVEACASRDQNSAKIIAAILGLADALDMETTVEGVEAFDQLEVVRERGAKLVQGHIFARAMPLEEVNERVASGDLKIEPDGPKRHRPERRSVFRRVGVIHENCRYEALMRDLSRTGARVDGLLGVPVGTGLVLDLGGGQLVVSNVVRSEGAVVGVEFETPLTSDGSGGLCTRHRVPPSVLAAAADPGGAKAKPHFVQVAVPGSRV